MARDAHGDRQGEATERVRQRYDRFAANYDRHVAFWERVLFAGGRQWVASRARGDVLEIAVGTGRNFPHYPRDCRITGIELSARMLAIARRRAAETGLQVDLRIADAQALDFPEQSFDTVVCTLSLCTIPDDRRAVAEAWRVLRPGGRLLLLEHVRSPVWAVRSLQRILEPVFGRLGGDHLMRESLEHVKREGFEIEHVERSGWGIVERLAAVKRA